MQRPGRDFKVLVDKRAAVAAASWEAVMEDEEITAAQMLWELRAADAHLWEACVSRSVVRGKCWWERW